MPSLTMKLSAWMQNAESLGSSLCRSTESGWEQTDAISLRGSFLIPVSQLSGDHQSQERVSGHLILLCVSRSAGIIAEGGCTRDRLSTAALKAKRASGRV